jgi:dihydroorotase
MNPIDQERRHIASATSVVIANTITQEHIHIEMVVLGWIEPTGWCQPIQGQVSFTIHSLLVPSILH